VQTSPSPGTPTTAPFARRVHVSRDAGVRLVGTEPALAEGGDVVQPFAVDEKGVVVPDDVGRVDGQEVGEGQGALRLGPEPLHLVCYLDEVGGAHISALFLSSMAG
jgi:hypothetical protein